MSDWFLTKVPDCQCRMKGGGGGGAIEISDKRVGLFSRRQIDKRAKVRFACFFIGIRQADKKEKVRSVCFITG